MDTKGCTHAVPRVEGGRRILGSLPAKTPLVSIITVVFNAAADLPPLLESITERLGQHAECIVIDGGSSDGTVDLLRAWDSRIDYWISEPDAGIYDAMNKGIAAARGDYILHMNAGDRLSYLPIPMLLRCLAEGVDVASFCVLVDGHRLFHPTAGFLFRLQNTWHHQGTFYRRASHLKYDSGYRIFGDFELNQRLFRENRLIRLFPEVVATHQDDGMSNAGRGFGEVYRSIRNHFGISHVLLAFTWYKYKGIRQRIQRLKNLCIPSPGSAAQ
jgi:glycosyltransferase involved in cell wall biosynthesis